MKLQKTIKILFILIATSLMIVAGNCMLPLANKTYLEHDPDVNAPRVTYEKQGAALIFSVIPTGEPLDLKRELQLMRNRHSCRTLKNIDAQYFNQSYYIVGFGKLFIRADCVK
ncbi:MAG: hypothetical protein RH862_05065 [Leptospiraceae bacterium]